VCPRWRWVVSFPAVSAVSGLWYQPPQAMSAKAGTFRPATKGRAKRSAVRGLLRLATARLAWAASPVEGVSLPHPARRGAVDAGASCGPQLVVCTNEKCGVKAGSYYEAIPNLSACQSITREVGVAEFTSQVRGSCAAPKRYPPRFGVTSLALPAPSAPPALLPLMGTKA